MNRAIGAIVVLLFAMRVDAQSLVVNGDFTAALDGWTVTGDGEAVPDPDDVDADPASGSTTLTHRPSDAASRVIPLRQCVGVSSGGEFLVAASSRVAPGQGSGKLVISVGLYGSGDCSSGLIGGAGRFLPAGEAWSSLAFVLPTPSATRSLLVVLGVDKADAGGRFSGDVDGVMLEQSPRLFDDGFE